MSLSFFRLHVRAVTAALVEMAAAAEVATTRIDAAAQAMAAQEQKLKNFLDTDIMGTLINQYLMLAELAKTAKPGELDLTRFGIIEDIIRRFSEQGRGLDFNYLRRRGTSGAPGSRTSSTTSTSGGTTITTASTQGKLPSSGGLRI